MTASGGLIRADTVRAIRRNLLALAILVASLLPGSLGAAEIPLGMTGGVYTAPVQINRSVTLEFLVDPGAGVVVIPTAVLNQLIQNGSITQSDILGTGTAETADRSRYRTATVKLRELRLGNIIVRDVTAAVSPGLTQPLLGQTFFRRFAYVTFDNRRQVLILPDDLGERVTQQPGATRGAPYPSYPAGGGYPQPPYYPGYGR